MFVASHDFPLRAMPMALIFSLVRLLGRFCRPPLVLWQRRSLSYASSNLFKSIPDSACQNDIKVSFIRVAELNPTIKTRASRGCPRQINGLAWGKIFRRLRNSWSNSVFVIKAAELLQRIVCFDTHKDPLPNGSVNPNSSFEGELILQLSAHTLVSCSGTGPGPFSLFRCCYGKGLAARSAVRT
jgi:hypothetical protein